MLIFFSALASLLTVSLACTVAVFACVYTLLCGNVRDVTGFVDVSCECGPSELVCHNALPVSCPTHRL